MIMTRRGSRKISISIMKKAGIPFLEEDIYWKQKIGERMCKIVWIADPQREQMEQVNQAQKVDHGNAG